MYYIPGNSLKDVINLLKENNPESPKPQASTIMRVIHKFEETGSIGNIKPPGRTKTATSEEMCENLLAKINVSPIKVRFYYLTSKVLHLNK